MNQFRFIISFLIVTGNLFAASPDWSTAQKVILVMPFQDSSSDQGLSLADSVQLRLRNKIEQDNLNAYVLSPVEVAGIFTEAENKIGRDNLKQVAEKLELNGHQELYVVTGRLKTGQGSQVKVEYVGLISNGQMSGSFSLADSAEDWKPKFSRRIVDSLIETIFTFTFTLGKKTTTLPSTTAPVQKWGPSILSNGGFEAGKDFQPKGWDPVDSLCSFWVKSNHGKCLLFDTDVEQGQAWDWWKAIKQGANPADAPKPIRTEYPHYNAVGGIEGVKLYSAYLPVKPGQTFLLTARIKGPDKGGAKIFVKAYALLPTAKSEKTVQREVWQTYLHCNTMGNEWKEYRQTFTLPATLPSVEKKTAKGEVKTYHPKIQWIRVMPYAYWEVGKYYFDDIKVQIQVP